MKFYITEIYPDFLLLCLSSGTLQSIPLAYKKGFCPQGQRPPVCLRKTSRSLGLARETPECRRSRAVIINRPTGPLTAITAFRIPFLAARTSAPCLLLVRAVALLPSLFQTPFFALLLQPFTSSFLPHSLLHLFFLPQPWAPSRPREDRSDACQGVLRSSR